MYFYDSFMTLGDTWFTQDWFRIYICRTTFSRKCVSPAQPIDH